MRKTIHQSPLQSPINAVLSQQIHNLNNLQDELKSIPLDSISMAQCVSHTKRLAKISAKIEAYTEVIDLLGQAEVIGFDLADAE
ncbi:MAG: hypothetical protein JXR47_05280 [Thiotrichales bacterium]|nr:hypothetical protein [Thiotrichales bacterium]